MKKVKKPLELSDKEWVILSTQEWGMASLAPFIRERMLPDLKDEKNSLELLRVCLKNDKLFKKIVNYGYSVNSQIL